jgi:hypothetical protein
MPKLLLPLLLLPWFGACDSKVTSDIDEDLRARVNTLQDCFPELYPYAEAVLDVADSWRLNDGGALANPAVTSFGEQPDGSVTILYNTSGASIAMTVRFYSPTGVVQDLSLGTPATLDDLVVAAATALRTAFPTGNPFLVGAWTLTGPGLTGNGALTGILGGTTAQPELTEVRTTTAFPAGGPPPLAAGTLLENGPPLCGLSFATPGLQIDRSTNQERPIGVLNLTVQGPEASVAATMTFDGSTVTRVVVQEVPGAFVYDLATRTLTFER